MRFISLMVIRAAVVTVALLLICSCFCGLLQLCLHNCEKCDNKTRRGKYWDVLTVFQIEQCMIMFCYVWKFLVCVAEEEDVIDDQWFCLMYSELIQNSYR